MTIFCKTGAVFALLCVSIGSAFALEPTDRSAIHKVIQGYTDAWNLTGGKGFGDGFAEDADFVNIFGMKFSGRAEIEERHVKIVQTFFKNSKLEILDTKLREVQPGLVIATIHWRLKGYRNPTAETPKPEDTGEGLFTQVFVHSKNKWEITASQNTVISLSSRM